MLPVVPMLPARRLSGAEALERLEFRYSAGSRDRDACDRCGESGPYFDRCRCGGRFGGSGLTRHGEPGVQLSHEAASRFVRAAGARPGTELWNQLEESLLHWFGLGASATSWLEHVSA